MCGIVGFVNLTKDISNSKNVITLMNESIKKRGPDEDGYYFSKNAVLGHKRLIVIDPDRWKTANDCEV